MSELQAGRSGESLEVARLETKSRHVRHLDLLIAAAAFVVLVALPFLFSSKALLDFVIRCAAYGLFATSLNLLVGYTGMISFGHGMFFGLGAYGFGLIMQRTGVPIPLAFLLTLGDHRRRRHGHRRDLRAAEGDLLRLRHAGVPDADPQHHPVVGARSPAAIRACAAAFRARHSSASIWPTICSFTSRVARCW